MPYGKLNARRPSSSGQELQSDITVADITGMGRRQPRGVSAYEFYVKSDGIAAMPMSVGLRTQSFHPCILGFFKTGAEAASLMETDNPNVIPYQVEATTIVLLDPKSGTKLPECTQPFQSTLIEFGKLLEKMTLASLPTPSLHLHKVESKLEGGSVTWDVKAVKRHA